MESINHDKPIFTVVLNISENYAEAAGSAVYGGLLNRCSVNPWYEPITDLVHIANIINHIHNLSSISSEPVGIYAFVERMSRIVIINHLPSEL